MRLIGGLAIALHMIKTKNSILYYSYGLDKYLKKLNIIY